MKHSVFGHLAALFTIFLWGSTFISTKVLLQSFSPIEIMITRFLIGFLVLILLHPRRMRLTERKQEWLFAAAGLTGVALYYLLETIALRYTNASNAGIIVSVSPFFTALLARVFLKEERAGMFFYLGFLLALSGIIVISVNSSTQQGINPLGDLLVLIASMIWAVYSIVTRNISKLGYGTIPATRRTFFYGILFLIPVALFSGIDIDLQQVIKPVNFWNLLFLGVGASAICFLTWNQAIRMIGAVKTSVYIYLAPVITVTMSALILDEPVTWVTVLGVALTLAGLLLSEIRLRARIKSHGIHTPDDSPVPAPSDADSKR